MMYDRGDYDYSADDPSLPPGHGGTHIGIFLAWAISHGLESETHKKDNWDLIAMLRGREITGRQFLQEACDDKLWEEDLSDEGNAFAHDYYLAHKGRSAYLDDYAETLAASLPSLYHVPDTWESYDRIEPVITRRYEAWKRQAPKSPLPTPRRKWWQLLRRT